MNFNLITLSLIVLAMASVCRAQDYQVKSPDQKIAVSLKNGDELSYSVLFNGKSVLLESELGFELKVEAPMNKGFAVIGKKEQTINETWKPVVKSKHAEVLNYCNELTLL